MNSIDIFGSLKSQANSNTVLGTRLSNMKNSVCPYTQQVISVNSNDTVNVNQATSFGLSLLATQDLNTLVSQLNQGDTALTISDAGVGQIDTKIDNTLIQQWKVSYSECLNELRTRSIIPQTTTSDLGSSSSPFRNGYLKRIDIADSSSNLCVLQLKENSTNTATNGGSRINLYGTRSTLAEGQYAYLLGARENTTLSNKGYFAIGVSSNDGQTPSERLRILENGNVGLSITNPSTTLDVNGSATIRGITSIATGSNNVGTLKIGVGTGIGGDTNWIGFGHGNTTFADSNDRVRIGCQIPTGGSGELYFTAGSNGGTEMMRITSTGVGIGTTPASSYVLDVRKTGVDAYARISGDVAKKQGLIFSDGATPTDIWTFYKKDTTKTLNIYNNTTSSDTMTFTSSNRVGINNNAPASVLSIAGTSSNLALEVRAPSEGYDPTTYSAKDSYTPKGTIMSFSNQLGAGTTPSTGALIDFLAFHNNFATNAYFGALAGTVSNGGASLVFGTRTGVQSWGETMRINPSGLVGIGTSNPVYNLHINISGTSGFTNSNDRRGLLLTDSTASRVILENTGGTSGQRLSVIQNYNNIWSVGVLNDSGSSWNKERILGINLGTYDTTFAGHILTDSVGSKNIGSLANPFAKIFTVDADISNLVSNCKTYNLTPSANNQYTIGASSTNQYSAIYGNNIYANGVSVSSDRRLKENIKPISNGLETVLKMKPVEYKMKNGVRLHTGFLADEMEHLYNNEDWACFVEQKDEVKTQSLQYMEVIAILAKAIQDLNSKVENRRLVGGSIIAPTGSREPSATHRVDAGFDTSSLTEDLAPTGVRDADFVSIYQRLESLESQLELVNKPVKPQLTRCIEVSRVNELFERISNLESQIHCNESKSNSEDFELVHSLIEKNHSLEMKVNELSDKILLLESKPKVEQKVEIEESDSGSITMVESLQERLYKAEQLISKQDKMIKKLTTAVNKLLKEA